MIDIESEINHFFLNFSLALLLLFTFLLILLSLWFWIWFITLLINCSMLFIFFFTFLVGLLLSFGIFWSPLISVNVVCLRFMNPTYWFIVYFVFIVKDCPITFLLTLFFLFLFPLNKFRFQFFLFFILIWLIVWLLSFLRGRLLLINLILVLSPIDKSIIILNEIMSESEQRCSHP